MEGTPVSPLPLTGGEPAVTDQDQAESDADSFIDPEELKKLTAAALEDEERRTLGARAPKTQHEAEGTLVLLSGMKAIPYDVQFAGSDMVLVGCVRERVEDYLIVASNRDATALDEGSLLCLDNGRAFCRVGEIFGQVSTPHYACPIDELAVAVALQNGHLVHRLCQLGLGPPETAKQVAECAEAGEISISDSPAELSVSTESEEGDAPAEKGSPHREAEPGQIVEETTAKVSSPKGESHASDEGKKDMDSQSVACQIAEVRDNLVTLITGKRVFYVPSDAQIIFRDQVPTKGHDASNIFDEELNPDQVEFSDDEEEAAAKRKKKSTKKRRPEVRKRPRPHISGPESASRAQSWGAPPQRIDVGRRVYPPQPFVGSGHRPGYAPLQDTYTHPQPQMMSNVPLSRVPQVNLPNVHQGVPHSNYAGRHLPVLPFPSTQGTGPPPPHYTGNAMQGYGSYRPPRGGY